MTEHVRRAPEAEDIIRAVGAGDCTIGEIFAILAQEQPDWRPPSAWVARDEHSRQYVNLGHVRRTIDGLLADGALVRIPATALARRHGRQTRAFYFFTAEQARKALADREAEAARDRRAALEGAALRVLAERHPEELEGIIDGLENENVIYDTLHLEDHRRSDEETSV